MADEYRIEFSIQRLQPGDDDFVEIGFGSSGGWRDLDAAVHAVSSDVQNGNWETEKGHPDPGEVIEQLRAARADAT